MTETPPEPTPHPWLAPSAVLAWLQLDDSATQAGTAELCRVAAARYCERQRPGLWVTLYDELGEPIDPPVFDADADVVMAGMIAAARLYARRSTPTGLASFGEFGASDILRLDPDVSRLLGTGRHADPAVG